MFYLGPYKRLPHLQKKLEVNNFPSIILCKLLLYLKYSCPSSAENNHTSWLRASCLTPSSPFSLHSFSTVSLSSAKSFNNILSSPLSHSSYYFSSLSHFHSLETATYIQALTKHCPLRSLVNDFISLHSGLKSLTNLQSRIYCQLNCLSPGLPSIPNRGSFLTLVLT